VCCFALAFSRFFFPFRQLQMYGFLKASSGCEDAGGYYHELFLKTRPSLCRFMHRTNTRRPTSLVFLRDGGGSFNASAMAAVAAPPPRTRLVDSAPADASDAAAAAAAAKRNDGLDPDFYSMPPLPTNMP
jgi:hypothetical protein